MFLKLFLRPHRIKIKKTSAPLFFISCYQAFFSGFTGGACRFYPSCSVYAKLVYKRHSFLKATVFVLKRLLNCHPLGPKWREEPEIQNFLEKC